MCITWYSHHGLLCVVCLYELHPKVVAYLCVLPVCVWSDKRGENIAHPLVRLLCQPGERCYRCCVSQERGCAVLSYAMVAAMSSASQPEENTHVCSSYSSWSLPPAFSLASVLPTLGWASSVNSKTIGITNRISNTRTEERLPSLKQVI